MLQNYSVDSLPNSPGGDEGARGSCIRKVADLKISEYEWTGLKVIPRK